MNPKIKAWDYLQKIKGGEIDCLDAGLILLALIENGLVYVDDVWPAKRLIEAYESVMGVEEE